MHCKHRERLTGSVFPIEVNAKFYYKYSPVSQRISGDKRVCPLVGGLNADDAGSGSLETPHSGYIGL